MISTSVVTGTEHYSYNYEPLSYMYMIFYLNHPITTCAQKRKPQFSSDGVSASSGWYSELQRLYFTPVALNGSVRLDTSSYIW